jgi:hypothetical protein
MPPRPRKCFRPRRVASHNRQAVALDEAGGVLVTYRLPYPYWYPESGVPPSVGVARWTPASGAVTSYRGADNLIEGYAYGMAETTGVAWPGFAWWGGELPALAPYAAGRYAASTPVPGERRQAAVFSPAGATANPAAPAGWNSEAVGVNAHGHAIVWQTGSTGTGSQAASVRRGGFYDGTAFTPVGELAQGAAGAFTGGTLDPRYLNDLGMILGYHVTGTGVPEAGIYQTGAGGGWTPLPGAATGLVLAGLTNGHTAGGRRALPTAYGWENIAPAGQPADLRPWVAYPKPEGGWKRERLKVATSCSGDPLRPVRQPVQGPFWMEPPPIFRMNDRGAAVFGNTLVLLDGIIQDLNQFLPAGWTVLRALDILNDGRILVMASQAVTTTDANGNPSTANVPRSAVLAPVVGFKLRDNGNVNKGWDSTGKEPWTVVGTGSTSTLVKLAVAPGMVGTISANHDIAVAPDSTDYISVSNVVATDTGINFDITGINQTSPTRNTISFAAQIFLRPKSSAGSPPASPVTTLNVRVFAPKEIKLDVFYVHDPAIPATAIPSSAPTASAIRDQLNAVFGPQANLRFEHRTTATLSCPGAFDANGKFTLPSVTHWGPADRVPGFPLDIVRVAANAASQYPTASGIQIFVIGGTMHYTPDPNVFGVGHETLGWCFIEANRATSLTYPHEVGHALGLSIAFKDENRMRSIPSTSADGAHDYGPWPSERSSPADTGLMFREPTHFTPWISQQDSMEANLHARELY